MSLALPDQLRRLLRPFGCLLLALTLASCATPEEASIDLLAEGVSLERELEQAQAALRAGRYRQAIERYRGVLRAEPDHLPAQLGLGEAYLASGANADALSLFTAVLDTPAVEDAPEFRSAARQGRGISLLRLGRVDEAQIVLSEVATADPTLWRAWNALGQAFDGLGDWNRARESYEQALWTAPKPARIRNNIGVSLMREGDHASALAQFGEALRADPDLEIARANLRIALAFQGRYVEALAGVPEKDLPDVLNNIGYIALMRGDYARAEAYFMRALEQSASFYEPAWKNLQYLATLTQ